MAIISVDNAARASVARLDVPRKMIVAEAIKAAAQVTTAYSGWVSDWVPCAGFLSGRLMMGLITMDATSFEFTIDTTDDATATTVTPTQDHDIGAPSSGKSAATPQEISFTCASYSAGDYVPIDLDLKRTSFFRVRVKRTGGNTANCTVSAKWVGGA